MELNFKKSGNGEPLIILHGLFGMLDNWQSMAAFFSSFFTVYNTDQRNHGKSPHNAEHSYMTMAEDLHGLCLHENIQKANIIGHSMGGKTAIQFALLYPTLVNKLVIVDVLPVKYLPDPRSGHFEVLDAAESIENQKFTNRKDAENELAEYIPDKRTWNFMLKNLLRKEDGTFGIKFNVSALRQNYPAMLEGIPIPSQVSIPVLFIKGGKSGYITENGLNQVRNHFPQMQVKTIPSAGHWVHADAPEEFKKMVMEFLG